jgi:hypothetical protein
MLFYQEIYPMDKVTPFKFYLVSIKRFLQIGYILLRLLPLYVIIAPINYILAGGDREIKLE